MTTTTDDRFVRAFNQGRKARADGKRRAECPYNPGPVADLQQGWLAGWDDANKHRRPSTVDVERFS